MAIMFQGWRIKLREAQQACRLGQLEEASRLLLDGELQRYRPGRQLSVEVAQRRAARAVSHFEAGDQAGAWREYQAAYQLAGETDSLLAARRRLLELGVQRVRQLASQGRCQTAEDELRALAAQLGRFAQLETLGQSIQQLTRCRQLRQRGRFQEALAELATAWELDPQLELANFQSQLKRDADQLAQVTHQMVDRAENQQWAEVVKLAGEVLQVAPNHRMATELLLQAREQLRPLPVDTVYADSQRPAPEHESAEQSAERRPAWEADSGEVAAREVAAAGAADAGAAAVGGSPGSDGEWSSHRAAAEFPLNRFLLWIDAVGGYLVCLANQVVLGQAAPGARVDVGLRGDLSRRHAIIHRQGENYTLQPLQPVTINGELRREVTLLGDGVEVQLGSVRFTFRQPHALSASARLDFPSGQRLASGADAVLLMAESCVLGPQPRNHIVCPQWSGDLVLFRHDQTLCCRAQDSIEVDGREVTDRGQLTDRSRIQGADFSLSLEPC